MMRSNDFKGLRFYILFLLVLLSFFTYSQSIGWRWLWSSAARLAPQTHSQERDQNHK